MAIPKRSVAAPRPLAFLIASLFLVCSTGWSAPGPLAPADEAKLSFDIPATPAPQALKKFSAQSGQQVLYSNRELAGVTTNEVKGRFTQEDALKRLLAGTPLIATRDRRNGAVAVTRETTDPNG